MRAGRAFVLSRDFASPPERVFAYLSEHEHLEDLFGAKITRLRSGDGHRNGVDSRRRIGPRGPLGFEETVVDFVPNELIVYRITRGGPLRGHQGTMRFSPLPGGGCRLEYRIRLASPLPGVAALFKRLLDRSIPAGLRLVDSRS